ncbi:MAG: HDOD domain-containing protein [Kineosporiaceae bacterium]
MRDAGSARATARVPRPAGAVAAAGPDAVDASPAHAGVPGQSRREPDPASPDVTGWHPHKLPTGSATVHIGRQPVYAADGTLYGFELLFRAAADATASGVGLSDGDAATTTTIVAAFTEFPLEEVLGGRLGFINLTRAFLVGELPLPFDPDHAVLEILESITVDEEVVTGARRLVEAGYRLALDDFTWSEAAVPLLELAEIVKVDVLGLSWPEVLDVVERCRPFGVTLLAERVEDEAMLQRCRDLGFTLFQGYHLGRPQTLTVDSLTPGQALSLQLIAELGDPETTAEDVERLLRRDPALTYRLMRIANSAAYAQSRKLATIRDAVVLVGMARLRGWLVLVALKGLPGSPESLIDSLSRARAYELLAKWHGLEEPEAAFTLGLLGGIASTLQVEPAEVVRGLPPLEAGLLAAMTSPPGRPAPISDLVTLRDAAAAYLGGDVAALIDGGVTPTTIARAYLEGLSWAETTCRAAGSDDD